MRYQFLIAALAVLVLLPGLPNGIRFTEAQLTLVNSKPEKPRLISVQKIWDRGAHNAFTSLEYFRGKFYCAFREGARHGNSADGSVRVLASEDGKSWKSVALMTDDAIDLRDADLSITADNQLLLLSVRAYLDGEVKHRPIAWLSKDGEDWSPPALPDEKNIWLWSMTWHDGTGYGIGYSTGETRFARLYKTSDGIDFQTLVTDLKIDSDYPNESSIVFDSDDKAYCLIRCQGPSQFGTAKPPYREWQWKSTGVPIGGPKMIQLPDGRLLATVRLYDNRQRTSLCWVDANSGKVTECLELPSGGDTSYAGMVWHDGKLWVSYYSSHEAKTSVYLATVGIDLIPRK